MTGYHSCSAALAAMDDSALSARILIPSLFSNERSSYGGSIACLVDCATIRDIMDDERASFSMEFSHFEQKR